MNIPNIKNIISAYNKASKYIKTINSNERLAAVLPLRYAMAMVRAMTTKVLEDDLEWDDIDPKEPWSAGMIRRRAVKAELKIRKRMSKEDLESRVMRGYTEFEEIDRIYRDSIRDEDMGLAGIFIPYTIKLPTSVVAAGNKQAFLKDWYKALAKLPLGEVSIGDPMWKKLTKKHS